MVTESTAHSDLQESRDCICRSGTRLGRLTLGVHGVVEEEFALELPKLRSTRKARSCGLPSSLSYLRSPLMVSTLSGETITWHRAGQGQKQARSA